MKMTMIMTIITTVDSLVGNHLGNSEKYQWSQLDLANYNNARLRMGSGERPGAKTAEGNR